MSQKAFCGAREKMKKPDDFLGNGNYFQSEFNITMTLAHKELESYYGKEVRGRFGCFLGSQRYENVRVYRTMSWSGASVKNSSCENIQGRVWYTWRTLEQRNLQNSVALTRRLHEFYLDEGSNMASHIDRFDELTLSIKQTETWWRKKRS